MKNVLLIVILFMSYSSKAQQFNMSYSDYIKSNLYITSSSSDNRYNQKSKMSEEELVWNIAESKFDNDDWSGAISALDLLISKNSKKGSYYYLRGMSKILLAYKTHSNKNIGCADLQKAVNLGYPNAKKLINDYCIVK